MSVNFYRTTRLCVPKDSTLVGFEVVTVVVMKSTVFWDITP
jgi:hypothetical protein